MNAYRNNDARAERCRRAKGRGAAMRSAAAALLFVLGWPSIVEAQLFSSPEFQVNVFTSGEQGYPEVASSGAGRFLVVWESDGQDGGGISGGSTAVVGRLHDMSGTALSADIVVNTYATSTQDKPDVAWDGVGNFVVVWKSVNQEGPSSNGGIFGQRFNSSGSAVGTEFQVNTYTTLSQNLPAIAADGTGGFLVVWESNLQDGSSLGVYGQLFNSSATPLGAEFRVNTYTTASQGEPAVVADGAGNYIVVWTSVNQEGIGGSGGVYAQRFDATATPIGTEFRVNTETLSGQDTPSVAADGAGNFVVAWESNLQDGSSKGVFAQRFASSGAALGTEFQVNTYTTLTQDDVDVVADAAGNFVVAWESVDQDGSPSGTGIFAQRYDSAGAAVGTEFQVNSYTTNGQEDAAIAIDASGDFAVVWNSNVPAIPPGLISQDGALGGIFGKTFSDAAITTTTTVTTTTITTTTTTTTLVPVCGTVAALGCKQAAPGKASVLLKKKGGTKDKFKWKFSKGDLTTLASFMDPTTNTAAVHRVCVYDASSLVMELDIPPATMCGAKPCWTAAGASGYKYKNKAGAPSGITSAKLKAGAAGKVQVRTKGKGALLSVPTLPLVLPVTVQMIIDDGAIANCWQTTYATTIKNDAKLLKAKGP